MNKVLPAILFLSSCGSISLSEVPIITSAIFNKVDSSELNITKEFYDARQYSFIKVYINNTVSTMTLSSVNGNKYTWVNAFDESLITVNGVIIETNGFVQDMTQIECIDIQTNKNYNFCAGQYGTSSEISQALFLSEPKAMIETTSSIIVQTGDAPVHVHDHDILYLQQDFISKTINWSGVNEFWYDPIDNLPIKTIQYYHPLVKPAEIEFYFIFE